MRTFLLLLVLIPAVLANPTLLEEGFQVEQENQSSEELFQLEKTHYIIGESVAIRITEDPEHLRITGPNSSYQYLGTPYNPLLFIPQVAGTYNIQATRNGGIDEQQFIVVEGIIPEESNNISLVEKGLTIDPMISFRDVEGRTLVTKRHSALEHSKAFSVLSNENNPLTAIIQPDNDLFTKLVLDGVRPADFKLGIGRPSKELVARQNGLKRPGERIIATYAVDPSGMNFTNGTLTRVAQGTILYKCASWSFLTETCPEGWEKYRDLEPGEEYNLEITPVDPAFAETGVATINAHKPIYAPGEEATLSMAVLDTAGVLVEGADVTVEITSPDDAVTILSTDDDTITEVQTGIYTTQYSGFDEGVYDVFVIATGPNVDAVMRSNYTVASTYAFDIYRSSPLSIDPWKGAYRTTIIVEPRNASGGIITVTEHIPSSFIVTNGGGANVQELDDTTQLTWTTDTGTPLTYYAQAPRVTPDLYPLGPVDVTYSGGVFSEARLWWLAIDPTDTLDPIQHVNTEVGGTDLTAGQVTDISTDDTAYVTFTKNTVLTVEMSDPVNATPIASVSSLSCSVTYTSASYSPAATFRVDEAFGANVLGSTTLPASTGGDNTVTLSNLQNDADFTIQDLFTLNVFISNNDDGQPQTISVDDVWCTVSYTEADVQEPTITLQDPTEDDYLQTNSVQFNYTPSDNVDFANCTLIINDILNASNSTPINNGTSNSITASFGDAAYNWTVQCFDGSGNLGVASEVRNFTVDTTAPTAFSLTAPANDTVSTDLTPTMTWTATSDLTFHNYTLLLDNNADFSSPNYVRERTLTTTNNTYTFTTIISSNTLYYWKVIAEDEVGLQTESSQTYVYITDTTTPTTPTLQTPASGTTSTNRAPTLDWTSVTETNFDNYTIQFDNNNDFSSIEHEYYVTAGGVANSSYQVQTGEQLGADDTFYWRVITYDRAGQSSTSASFNYTTDNTPPAIAPEFPTPGYVENLSNTIVFNYSVTDVTSAVTSCELVVNGTSEQTDSPITEGVTQSFEQFLSNGYYEWWVNCTDAVGNEAEGAHRFLTMNVTVDVTPPTLLLHYPENNLHVNTTTIQFNYTPQDATGIMNCSLYADGVFNTSNATAVTNNQPNYFTVGVFTNALHNWSVACYDNSTNENFQMSSTYNFTVDNVLPASFSITSPANNTITDDNTQLLVWTQTTEDNFKNYTVTLDTNSDFSSPEYYFYNTSITETSHSSTALADGTYFWKVTAYDLAGNSRESTETFLLTIDTTPPTYTNVTETPTDPTEYNPSQIYNFTIEVTDERLDTVIFENDFSGSLVNSTPNSSGTTYWYSLVGLPTDVHGYRWFMNDTLGNMNMTAPSSYTITKNTTTVTLFLDGGTNNLTINESQILNITGTLNWPASGTVQLRRNGTLLNQSTSPVMRLFNFTTPGYYVLNASYAGSSNYYADSEILYATVDDVFSPDVQLVTPGNATIDDDGEVSYGFSVSDSNTIANCSLYLNGAFNETKNSPAKDTTLFFNKAYDVDQNVTWEVRCVDDAGLQGFSPLYDLEIDIAIFTNALVPQTCADQDGCTASNMNVSDPTFEDHGILQKTPTRDNYVYANVTNASIPLGATILNASVLWDKYQITGSGTFFLSWRNGSNWDLLCQQVFTASSTGTTDPVACTYANFPTINDFNGPLQLRGNFFYSGNPSGQGFGTNYVEVNVTYQEDTTPPAVELTEPTDEDETGAGAMIFNITATDQNLQTCTLYGDFNGSWGPNTTITINDNLTSGSKSSFLPVDLAVGFYTWNTYCVDIANNAAFAPANFSVNITPPDLSIVSNDITFPGEHWENKNVTLFANVYNLGFTTAFNFVVQFFLGDPDSGGTQIGNNQTITELAFNQNETVDVTYIAPIGPSQIFVLIDGDDTVVETNENNNKASNTLDIPAYNRLYGNTTRNITLDNAGNKTLLTFVTETNNTGNLFFARGGSSISFQDLKPVGRTTTNLSTADDFSNADALLNMTGFNDSVNARWANNTDTPINTTTFNINQQEVADVPIIPSDVGANFVTGILWDSSDDVGSNLEYDVTDKEDLVFIANAESGLVGSFGVHDYEAVIPARLREYAGGPVEMIEIYFELT